LDAGEDPIDAVGLGLVSDPDVDEAVRPTGDDVACGATLDSADIDRGSGARIRGRVALRCPMISARAWTALAPTAGSLPAWASMPVVVIVKLPAPLRPILTSQPTPGSSTNAAALSRAAVSMWGRETGLPSSSSPLNRNLTVG
jgi:hypothetical protein